MQIMNYCRMYRFYPHVINQFNDMKSVLLCISAGLGISILPITFSREISASSIEVVPIDHADASITCAVAWRKSLLNPAAALFLRILQEQKPKDIL